MEIIGYLLGGFVAGAITLAAVSWRYAPRRHKTLQAVNPFPHSYHVSFYLVDEINMTTVGAMNIRRTKPIATSNDVMNVQEYIKREHNAKSAAIISWQLLDD